MAGILLENETQEILDGAQQTSQLVHSELCLLTTSAQIWKSKEILDSERTWDKETYITSPRPPLSYHTHVYIGKYILQKCFSSVQSLSCVGLYHQMDCSTPGFPIHHQLSEIAQTHIHPISDAIQPSHSLSSPSPPTFNISQHQGLFQ